MTWQLVGIAALLLAVFAAGVLLGIALSPRIGRPRRVSVDDSYRRLGSQIRPTLIEHQTRRYDRVS